MEKTEIVFLLRHSINYTKVCEEGLKYSIVSFKRETEEQVKANDGGYGRWLYI